MKILFLTARYPPDVLGGGEVSTRILAEALAASGLEVSVLCGSTETREERLQGVRVLRDARLRPWWEKPLHERYQSQRAADIVRALLAARDLHPDILHAQEFRSALTLSLLPFFHRVVTIRDFAPICGTTNNLWWDGSACDGCFWTNVLFRCHRVVEAPLLRKPFRVAQYKGNLAFRLRAFRRIQEHVYTSAVLQERVGARLQPPRSVASVVIPNPVDPAWLAEPLTPLPDTPTLCSTGRLETTKGTDVLLEALVRLRDSIRNVHLHLVGGGEIARYRRRVAALRLDDHVTFHGAVLGERVRELMDASAVIVSPHVWEEPFGRSALEAGARGRPLVASDLGGVRETTTPDTAVLVPPRHPRALASALRVLLAHPDRQRSLGRAAREHVAARYSTAIIVAQHLSLYQRLLGPLRSA